MPNLGAVFSFLVLAFVIANFAVGMIPDFEGFTYEGDNTLLGTIIDWIWLVPASVLIGLVIRGLDRMTDN